MKEVRLNTMPENRTRNIAARKDQKGQEGEEARLWGYNYILGPAKIVQTLVGLAK